MSQAWLCIPSARPPEEAGKVLKLWKERGYKIALWRDGDCNEIDYGFNVSQGINLKVTACEYPGYAEAVNRLIVNAVYKDPSAEWFIAAGDDTEPDPNHSAEEIAAECFEHFSGTFGVMQPTGDRWHEGVGGFTNAPIDRVAGSAWYGREYCRRMYRGKGPLWHEFDHMFVDEHAQCVAQKLGVLWQRRDLVQRHSHWGRGDTDKALVRDPVIPPHLVKWNTREHWDKSKAIFERLKAGGFAEAADLLTG